MELTDLVKQSCIKVPLAATNKADAIAELVDVLAQQGVIGDAQVITTAVMEREGQRSTGIGEGLAVPHGRCDKITQLEMAMGIPAEPIDFSAYDHKPVRLIALLISPQDNTAAHIQALGRISRFFADRVRREEAYACDSADSLYELMTKAAPQEA
jgi:mannitol/fructose-specific phosphotransferase system IIA component (Ntr-type)